MRRVITATYYCYCFYEAKLCLRKFILLLSFSQETPLHLSASWGQLEVTRLLVESKADVAARTRCFSPPPSHHLSLTICLAAMEKLHSNMSSTPSTKPTFLNTCANLGRAKPPLLYTCATSALPNDVPPRRCRCLNKSIKAFIVRWGCSSSGRKGQRRKGRCLPPRANSCY